VRAIPGLTGWVTAIVASVAAGAIVLAVWGDGTAGITVGWTLIGAAGVLAVSFVFYAIGVGEDRDRAAGGDLTRRRPPQ